MHSGSPESQFSALTSDRTGRAASHSPISLHSLDLHLVNETEVVVTGSWDSSASVIVWFLKAAVLTAWTATLGATLGAT